MSIPRGLAAIGSDELLPGGEGEGRGRAERGHTVAELQGKIVQITFSGAGSDLMAPCRHSVQEAIVKIVKNTSENP